MKNIAMLLATMALAVTIIPSAAQEFKAAGITVQQPWTRATPKGASVAAGYAVIRNSAPVADKLTGGSADFASAVQVHEMSITNGVMKMRELPGGLDVPAKGQVALTPRAYHIMFLGLKQPLTKGATVKVTLTFANAGSIPVEFKVGGIGDLAPAGAPKPHGSGMGDMPGMKM